VKPDEYSRSEGAAQFRTTRWTVIMLAAQGKNPAGEAALAEFYRLYWSALYAFARYRGYSPQDAQDLTQGFFVHVIEHETLTRAGPLKGKFRSFLLGSFQKYLSVDAQRARCLKREEAPVNLSVLICRMPRVACWCHRPKTCGRRSSSMPSGP
jgi:hypothetical protein